MTCKAGTEILNRPTVVVLVRTVAFNTSQLSRWGIRVDTKPWVGMTIGTVSCLCLYSGMVGILIMAVVTGHFGSTLTRINH